MTQHLCSRNSSFHHWLGSLPCKRVRELVELSRNVPKSDFNFAYPLVLSDQSIQLLEQIEVRWYGASLRAPVVVLIIAQGFSAKN